MNFTKTTIDALVTTDIMWNKYGISQLLDYADIMRIHNNHKSAKNKDRLVLPFSKSMKFPSFPHAEKILELGRGHVSLCGGSLVSILYGKECDYNDRYDLDFYFHSFEKVDDASNKLKEILQYLALQSDVAWFYRNENVITLEDNDGKNYQFILRFYENRKQILHGFDLWGCQIGYDPEEGIFAIPTGAYAVATKRMIVDLTKCSTSYISRISKYQNTKRFEIFDTINGLSPLDWNIINSGNLNCDYSYSDYNSHCSEHFNWYYAATKQYNKISVRSEILDHILFGRKEYVPRILQHFDINLIKKFSNSTIDKFFPDKEQARQFKILFHVDKDVETYTAMWNNRLAVIIKDVQDNLPQDIKWNVKEPATQRFGQVNPIIINPKEFYDEHTTGYVPKYAGIHPEMWLAIRACRKWNPLWQAIPKDLFYMLMKYICIAQYQHILKTILLIP